MIWRGRKGTWVCEPFTVRTQLDERSKLITFELYDGTRFVKAFGSVQEAKQWARGMAYQSGAIQGTTGQHGRKRAANDNQVRT